MDDQFVERDASANPYHKYGLHESCMTHFSDQDFFVKQFLDEEEKKVKKLKEERSRVLWRAVEKAIPDVRKRVEMEFVGTPLTQKRFQRRHKGSYGGTGWITEDSDTVPSTTASTPIDGLMCVGDSNFPGPGVPSVSAHGWSAAHELTSFWEQCKMLDKVAP